MDEAMRKAMIVMAAAMTLLCGCAREKDPMCELVSNYLSEKAGEPLKVKFYTMEKADSTSYRTEFERRIHVFEVRIRENTKKYDTFVRENKQKNAALKYQSVILDRERIGWLRDAFNRMEANDSLDITAYYDYHFSGHASGATTVGEYDDVWFSVTTDGRIMKMSQDRSDIHKPGGSVIPGYSEMLLGADDSEEVEE